MQYSVDDDPILQRARMLVQGIHANVNVSIDVINQSPNKPHPAEYTCNNQPATKIEINENDFLSFKCGVINGSSYVTTYADIRGVCKQGSSVYIEGIRYELKGIGGEWSHNCVELSSDYKSCTNFEALLSVSKIDNIKATHRLEYHGMKPVPSLSILEAVKDLDIMVADLSFNRSDSSSTALKPIKSSTSSSKGVLLKYQLDCTATDQYSDQAEDRAVAEELKIKEELKKTQERIAQWKQKIEMKLHEDALLQHQRSKRSHHTSTALPMRTRVLPMDPSMARRRVLSLSSLPEDDTSPSFHSKAKKEKEKEKEKEEIDAEAIAEENEKKVLALRERTLQRVQLYKSKVMQQEQEERDRRERMELEKRNRAEAIPQLRDRFLSFKQQTELRLQQLAKEEELRQQKLLQETEKRLQDIAELRGRQKPTAEWFNNNDDDKDANEGNGCQDSTSTEEARRHMPKRCCSTQGDSNVLHNEEVAPLHRAKSGDNYRHRLLKHKDVSSTKLTHSKSIEKGSTNLSIEKAIIEENPHSTDSGSESVSMASNSVAFINISSSCTIANNPMNQMFFDMNDSPSHIHDLKGSTSDGNISVLSDISDDDIDYGSRKMAAKMAPQGIASQLSNFELSSKSMKKKRSTPVWKLKPIEVRPYIPIPQVL